MVSYVQTGGVQRTRDPISYHEGELHTKTYYFCLSVRASVYCGSSMASQPHLLVAHTTLTPSGKNSSRNLVVLQCWDRLLFPVVINSEPSRMDAVVERRTLGVVRGTCSTAPGLSIVALLVLPAVAAMAVVVLGAGVVEVSTVVEVAGRSAKQPQAVKATTVNDGKMDWEQQCLTTGAGQFLLLLAV